MSALHPRWEAQFARRSLELTDRSKYTSAQITEAMHTLGDERIWHVEHRKQWHRLSFFMVGSVSLITAGIYELALDRSPEIVGIVLVILGTCSMWMTRKVVDEMAHARTKHDCVLVDKRIDKDIRRSRWKT